MKEDPSLMKHSQQRRKCMFLGENDENKDISLNYSFPFKQGNEGLKSQKKMLKRLWKGNMSKNTVIGKNQRKSATAVISIKWTEIKWGAVERTKTCQNDSNSYPEIKEETEIKRKEKWNLTIIRKIFFLRNGVFKKGKISKPRENHQSQWDAQKCRERASSLPN